MVSNRWQKKKRGCVGLVQPLSTAKMPSLVLPAMDRVAYNWGLLNLLIFLVLIKIAGFQLLNDFFGYAWRTNEVIFGIIKASWILQEKTETQQSKETHGTIRLTSVHTEL